MPTIELSLIFYAFIDLSLVIALRPEIWVVDIELQHQFNMYTYITYYIHIFTYLRTRYWNNRNCFIEFDWILLLLCMTINISNTKNGLSFFGLHFLDLRLSVGFASHNTWLLWLKCDKMETCSNCNALNRSVRVGRSKAAVCIEIAFAPKHIHSCTFWAQLNLCTTYTSVCKFI